MYLFDKFLIVPYKYLEGMHVLNCLTAALNSKSPEYGYSMMNSQYIEPEQMVRIMLWGTPMFMKWIMSLLSDMSHGESDDYE